ncbi:MAG: hypothetical protein J7L32_03060 [Thermoplasmata archaeon]|nr:hypothetical protein [Thermoplasmata archaeon]
MTIIKPIANSLYVFNRRIPFIGTIIIGSIDVEVNVTDDGVVNHVEFYIDEDLKNSVATEPSTWIWSEKNLWQACSKSGSLRWEW